MKNLFIKLINSNTITLLNYVPSYLLAAAYATAKILAFYLFATKVLAL